MRALLWILIGGGLLWLLIQGFGPSLARDAESEHSSGVLLHEESPGPSETAPTQAQPAAETTPVGDPSPPAVVAPPPEASPAKPAISEPGSPAGESQPAGASPSPDPAPAGTTIAEVEIAARLAHQSSGFVEWLGTTKDGLAPGRRSFAKALGLQLNGRTSEAGELVRELGRSSDLGADERKLIEFWPQGPTFALPEAGTPTGSLLVRAAGMASAEVTGKEALAAGRWADAAESYSRLLQHELRGPWEPDAQCMAQWADALNQAQRGYRWNRKGAWPALELKVEPGDSLIAIRKRALQERTDLITCTGLIARANQLQGETIQPGQMLRVPTGKPHVFVDLSAHWLLYLLDDEVLAAWPVGVGKPGSETPPGRFKVGEKSTDPAWFRAGQAPVPAGDPRNPLGTRWVAWLTMDGEKTHLGFHGTRDPASIGQDESEGCVRMLNRHMEELYEILPRGSEILLQP